MAPVPTATSPRRADLLPASTTLPGPATTPAPDAVVEAAPREPERDVFARAVRDGDRFWKRPEILRVRVSGLPSEVDGNVLRNGRGITAPDVTTTAWFGGPNSESRRRMSGLVEDGATYVVEWRGETGLAISGNTSLWDACPTWRVALPPDHGTQGLIPGGKWKLAQNNRDLAAGMRRMLAGELFRLGGVPIGRARPAEVTLHFGDHASYEGVRTFVEPKKSMLQHLFPDSPGGSHYELNWTRHGPANFKLSEGESALGHLRRRPDVYKIESMERGREPYADLAKFVDALHRLSPEHADRVAAFESVFDVRGFLRELAVAVAIGNWDGYVETASNAELYNVGKGGQDHFVFIPNDTDNTFGISYHKQDHEFVNWAKPNVFAPQDTLRGGPKFPLIEKTLAVPQYRQYYADFLEHFVDHVFTPGRVESLLGTEDDGASGRGFWPVIKDAAYREGNLGDAPRTKRPFTNDQLYRHGVRHEEFQNGVRKVEGIKHFTTMSRGHIKHEISKYRAEGHPRVFTSFDAPYRPVTPPVTPESAPAPRASASSATA